MSRESVVSHLSNLLAQIQNKFSSINSDSRIAKHMLDYYYLRLTDFLCVVPRVPDGKRQNHPEIVLLISSSAMPLFPPDPPSPTWNSEAEPPEPPEPLESDDDGNERFHGKMTNKISDAPALRSKCVLTLTPLLLPPPAAGRRPCPPLVDRDRVIPHSAHARNVDFDFRRDPHSRSSTFDFGLG